MAHIFLFGKASLEAFANTLLLNATINYILSRQIWRKSSLVLCIFLLYLNLLNFFFRYANVFFLWLYIYFHLVLRFAFISFFIIIFFLHSLFVYTQVALEYLRNLVIVIFWYICLYVLYSYVYINCFQFLIFESWILPNFHFNSIFFQFSKIVNN